MYRRNVGEDKLPQQNEGRWRYKKSEKLWRNKTYIGNGQKYKVTLKKQTALPAQLYTLNHFHHIQLLWQIQPKDLAGLSKTNRVLGEGRTHRRTNKTIWHYFYWSAVLISSLREIKDFLRAHKENQLKQHILTPCEEKKKKGGGGEIKRYSFIFFPKRHKWKKVIGQVGWKSKILCEAHLI